MNGRKAAIFLDKDGTLVEDAGYSQDPSRIHLIPGVPEGLRLLAERGYPLVLVSNQDGIAHGKIREEGVLHMSGQLKRLLKHECGVSLRGFYFCPHHPRGKVPLYARECDCRKPREGMLLKAAEEMNLDLNSSWFIGDILDDMEAGNRAGCETILLNNGHETEWRFATKRLPRHVVSDFYSACLIISRRAALYEFKA